MTKFYTDEYGDRLTFFFPEKIEASPFRLSEYNRATAIGYHRYSETKEMSHSDIFFILTLQDEPSDPGLNLALQNAIKNQKPVEVTVFRNHEEAYKGHVVVSGSATEEPNDYRLIVVKA